MTFLADLRAKGACSEGYAWARRHKVTSAADAWARLERPDWMLWLAEHFEVRLDPGLVQAFSFECADRAVRIHAVAALRSAGLGAEADRLAGLPRVVDVATADAARAAARAARDAAWAAAGDAAWAAWAAAWAAEELWEAERLRQLFPDVWLVAP